MAELLPGDLVEFIDDKTRGIIISVIDHKTLLVDIDDGLEIPVLKDKVVKIQGSGKNAAPQQAVYSEVAVKKIPDRSFKPNLYIAISNSENEQLFKFYLINNTSDFYYFTFYRKDREQSYGISKGHLNSGEYYPLTQVDISKLNKFPEYQLFALPYKESSVSAAQAVSYNFRPDGAMLLKDRETAPVLGEEACLIKILGEKEAIHFKEQKIERIENPIREIIDIEKPPKIIDLHIREIKADYQAMGASEILEFQFRFFVNTLEKAQALSYQKIIFIHGIGVNTLKNKIYDYLKNSTKVKNYQEADIRKYGYGAVEVDIK